MVDVTSFRGKYFPLTNFYNPCPIKIGKYTVATSEHVFKLLGIRSPKLNQVWVDKIVATPHPEEAKSLGRRAPLRDNWATFLSMYAMVYTVGIKLDQHPKVFDLVKSINGLIVEGNWWHDNRYGSCICDKCKLVFPHGGMNILGIIHMSYRDGIYDPVETPKKIEPLFSDFFSE